jgi:glyoxylase-like metal-dependent hydrolase (beta-lactamase superfamily II)
MLRPRELFPGTTPAVALFPTRTPTLAPATHTNSYAIGGRDVLLVEPATPYEDEQQAFVAWARELASTGRRLVAIVATHHHEDHVGGAAFLSRELGLPVWAHEATAARVDVPVARRLVDGDRLVLDGPTPEAWDVLHTPGHAPGHVCLFEPESRTAIVGDMVASVGTILIAPGDGDMGAYFEQLGRLAALRATVALPAHGEPIEEPTVVFHRYVSHRRMREEKIVQKLAAHGESGATAMELVRHAYDEVPPAIWPIAALSVEAHLEKLERDGKVARTARPGAFRVVASE